MPVLCAGQSDPSWTSRFASPASRFSEQVRLSPSSLTTPIVCRTFQSFGALRNLPCAAERSMRAIFGCRIDLRVSMKVRSAGLRPALALLLDTLGKMRGGAPRSNLQAPVCMRRIDPSSRHSGRACAIRNPRAESCVVGPGFRVQCFRIAPE